MSKKVVFLWDTETTSKDVYNDDIISLAGILCEVKNGEFITRAKFNQFIYTDRQIDPHAFEIHKISNKMLIGKPRFKEVIEGLKQFFRDNINNDEYVLFMAHNGHNFDIKILFCSCIRHGILFLNLMKDLKVKGFIDTLPLMRKLFKDHKDAPRDITGKIRFSLGVMFKSFCKKNLDGYHDALIDAQAMIDILMSPVVKKVFNISSLLKETVPLEKEHDLIRRSCGTKYQIMEEKIHGYIGKRHQIFENNNNKRRKISVKFDGECNQQKLMACLACLEFHNPNGHHECEGKDPIILGIIEQKGNDNPQKVFQEIDKFINTHGNIEQIITNKPENYSIKFAQENNINYRVLDNLTELSTHLILFDTSKMELYTSKDLSITVV